MRRIKEFEKIDHACVAYGFFDGVHLGHLAVLRQMKKLKLTSAVISFKKDDQVLTTETEKAFFFEKEGIDVMVSVPEPECSPAEFVLEVLGKQMGAEVLVIGENHRDRDIVMAAAEQAGIRVVVAETAADGKGPITGDRVLRAFRSAEFEKFAALCGHPYLILGDVVHGKALGRTVGMPTANQKVILNKRKPESGVYATISHVSGGTYESLTNIGTRPSVDDSGIVTVESYLLDFDEDIYGEPFCLEVWKFIRPVYKFRDLEAVKEQVKRDIGQVKDFLDKLEQG